MRISSLAIARETRVERSEWYRTSGPVADAHTRASPAVHFPDYLLDPFSRVPIEIGIAEREDKKILKEHTADYHHEV